MKQGQVFEQMDCVELQRPKTSRDCPNNTDNYVCASYGTVGDLIDIKYDLICEVYKCCRNASNFLELSSLVPYESSTGFQVRQTNLSNPAEMVSVPVPVTVVETTQQPSSCNSLLSNLSIYLFILLTAIALFYCQY